MRATPGPSDEYPETFNRDEYADILDDGERPTEHWDPDALIGPGGKTMAEALADLRAGKQIMPMGRRDDSVTEQFRRGEQLATPPPPAPPDAYALDDAADWKPNRNNQMIVGGLIAVAVGILLLYFLIT
jgi:hypothetical protein